MLPSLNEARASLLFPESAEIFTTAATALQQAMDADGSARAADLAMSLYLDLGSFLAEWTLKRIVEVGTIDAAVDGFAAVARKHGTTDVLDAMRTEREAIAASQILRMCQKSEAGELATYWGHDYCTGMSHSLRRGARWVTSNPAKINLFRKENPDAWTRLLAEAREENPGAPATRLISAMFVKVTAINARVLKPIWDATGGGMLEEMLYWEEAFRKELGYDPVNVVYKLPAVKAAMQPVRELTARGIRVCMTLSFSVSQHEQFAEIIQQGRKKAFVVLMAGFLDDNVALELGSLGVADAKSYAKWAGVAVMRKSCANLRSRGLDKAVIMAAAIRGPYTINCCITDHVDAPVLFTTMTEKINEFDAAHRSLTCEMAEPVPADILAVLEKSAIFNQAYNRDRLDMDTVNDFVPLKAVLKVFVEAYEKIERSLSYT